MVSKYAICRWLERSLRNAAFQRVKVPRSHFVQHPFVLRRLNSYYHLASAYLDLSLVYHNSPPPVPYTFSYIPFFLFDPAIERA